MNLASIDFGPVYERVKVNPDLEPGEVLTGDTVINAGTGTYHREKRRAS